MSERERAPALGPVLLGAVLAKVLVIALLVASAERDPGDSPYLAPREGDANDVVWYLSRGFDANAYQRMAVHGPDAEFGWYDRFSRAFPLGYPALIRATWTVTGNTQTAAVLVSNLASLIAVVLFWRVARRYAAERGGRAGAAALLFAVTPGVLAFGTVAYSESTFLALALGAWLAYLRAEDGQHPRRSLGWLLLASLLGGLSVMTRHLGAPLFVAWGLVEGVAVLRARGHRGRALLEAATLLSVGVVVAGYFVWKFRVHDMAGIQRELWDMRFVPFGGLPSLLSLGVSVETIVQIFMSLPVALLLFVKLRCVDGRLALLCALLLFLALSYTGIAAQATNRYVWTIWPLALGALALSDRAVVWCLVAVLFLVSLWCATGQVLGSAAL